jgi:hypothetical protein
LIAAGEIAACKVGKRTIIPATELTVFWSAIVLLDYPAGGRRRRRSGSSTGIPRDPMCTAANIARALGGTGSSGGWYRARCPVHASHGATLALRDRVGGLVVHCHAGCAPAYVLAELGRLGLLHGEGGKNAELDTAAVEHHRAAEARERQQRIANALDLWGE